MWCDPRGMCAGQRGEKKEKGEKNTLLAAAFPMVQSEPQG